MGDNSPPMEGCPQDGVANPAHRQDIYKIARQFPSYGGVSVGRGG